jgi:hypothetical protein
MRDASAVDKAIEGSTYVVHTASPLSFTSNNEDELVKPVV